MTEEQKFIFDLKGSLLIPEVLNSSEIEVGGPDNGKNLRYDG